MHTTCRSCKERIDEDARRCPHCRARDPTASTLLGKFRESTLIEAAAWLGFILLGTALLLDWAGAY